MANQSIPPSYNKEQATAWLAWLAYNMHTHDLTIFQIENLQPAWLAGYKEMAPNMFVTRMLWGGWAGLISGLLFGLLFVLRGGLLEGLLGGLFGGLFGMLGGGLIGLLFGLSELTKPIRKLDASLHSRGHSIKTLLIGTIAFGLPFGLLSALLGGLLGRLLDEMLVWLRDGLLFGLLAGLFGGLLGGLVRTFRISLREGNARVHTIDSLHWSWQNVRRNAPKGLLLALIFVLIFGLFGGLLVGLSDGLSGGLLFGLNAGLLFGLLGMLLFVLIGGFRSTTQELKTRPNQGIWLTIYSSIKIALPTGIAVGVLLGLLLWDITVGFGYGIVLFFIVGLWYGGLDVIEHGIIRLIIAWQGHAPLNYARFLDYAAEELNFLQKVGGGYVFIHRYLLEHFVEIAVEKEHVTEHQCFDAREETDSGQSVHSPIL
ncbi:MAG: hypothetical protein AAF702_23280 [Chloroflexota bacterium]